VLEAAPVDDLGRQHHRLVQRDAAEALQATDHGHEVGEQRELFDADIGEAFAVPRTGCVDGRYCDESCSVRGARGSIRVQVNRELAEPDAIAAGVLARLPL
jgi:hypothetical protein